MNIIDGKKLLVIVDRTTTSDMLSHFCVDHVCLSFPSFNVVKKLKRAAKFFAFLVLSTIAQGGGGRDWVVERFMTLVVVQGQVV